VIRVTGVGWIHAGTAGTLFRAYRRGAGTLREIPDGLREDGILPAPSRRLQGADAVSLSTCCAAALALFDAGEPRAAESGSEIGIIGTNREGCLPANIDFFRDYVVSGRVLGRGQRFARTLPTSPLAEAAILLKLKGPLLYLGFIGNHFSSLLLDAERMVRFGEAPALVAVLADSAEGVAVLIAPETGPSRCPTLEPRAVAEAGDRGGSVPERIEAIGRLTPRSPCP